MKIVLLQGDKTISDGHRFYSCPYAIFSPELGRPTCGEWCAQFEYINGEDIDGIKLSDYVKLHCSGRCIKIDQPDRNETKEDK